MEKQIDFSQIDRKKLKEELKKEFKELQNLQDDKLTFGQKVADAMTNFGGSWSFIIVLAGCLVLWILLNTCFIVFKVWDPYPFILLNLSLSFLAAFQAPIILMSQNREEQRSKIKAEEDFIINRLAEMEVADMQNDLEIIKKDLKFLKKALKGKSRKKGS